MNVGVNGCVCVCVCVRVLLRRVCVCVLTCMCAGVCVCTWVVCVSAGAMCMCVGTLCVWVLWVFVLWYVCIGCICLTTWIEAEEISAHALKCTADCGKRVLFGISFENYFGTYLFWELGTTSHFTAACVCVRVWACVCVWKRVSEREMPGCREGGGDKARHRCGSRWRVADMTPNPRSMLSLQWML